jgi:hypothetical protein
MREAHNIGDDIKEEIFLFESDTETFDKRKGGGVQMTPLRVTAFVIQCLFSGMQTWMIENGKCYDWDFLLAIRRLVVPGQQTKSHTNTN